MVDLINVIIVEDDVYALNLMATLLARDWRTRVIAEFGGSAMEAQVGRFLASNPNQRIHVAVIDAEMVMDPEEPLRIARQLGSLPHPPVILLTATQADERIFKRACALPTFGGFLIKQEVSFALASAVTKAAEKKVVVTPSLVEMVCEHIDRHNVVEISGMDPMENLTVREKEIARLGILYNLTQRDISDELALDSGYIADVISQVYDKVDLRDLINGSLPVEEYFQNPVILRKFREVIEAASGEPGRGKAPNMSTFAFHLLTRPTGTE